MTDHRACYNCEETRHIKRDCTQPRQAGAGGGRRRRGRGRNRACYTCGETGHISRDCSQPRKEEQQPASLAWCELRDGVVYEWVLHPAGEVWDQRGLEGLGGAFYWQPRLEGSDGNDRKCHCPAGECNGHCGRFYVCHGCGAHIELVDYGLGSLCYPDASVNAARGWAHDASVPAEGTE